MIYKVMLIDDDVPMLKLLQQMIDWEQLQLKVVAATYSSVKAVHLFQQTVPDIVITDIGLPQKNGIELAEQFRQLKPDVRVIFLTCHEDFNYARQALKLQADDYLIKDQLTEEQLQQSLHKSLRLLKKQSSSVSVQPSSYNQQLLKQGLLQSVLDRTNVDEILKYAAGIGVRWNCPWYMLSLVHVQYASYDEHYSQQSLSLICYAVYNIAEELARKFEGITPFLQQQHLVIVYNYHDNLADNTVLHFNSYLQKLKERVAQYMKLQLVSVMVSDKLQLKQMGTCYHSLLRHKYEFYVGESMQIADRQQAMGSTWLQLPAGELDNYKVELKQALAIHDIDGIQRIIGSMKQHFQARMIEPASFMHELQVCLRELTIAASVRLDEAIFNYMEQSRTLVDVLALAERTLTAMALPSDKQGKQGQGTLANSYEPKLQQIQHYIEQNLADSITSIDIARYLYLNPSYFSRYFKRMTGSNFTDYVHQYKMNIASQMLKTSGHTLEQIALTLGYSDRTYFSKVFKKYMGVTPSEYKNECS
ncbi:response regulator [Paenibacillus sp. KS1]|uniref:response regulator transcription factor n=1 Tax=Paenibacillus sp. KS1 TaxID=1849249 RepID=UPI0009F435CE|nr:response regulator [Paenibacillus sp. KS1]